MLYVRNLFALGCLLLFLDYSVYKINISPDWLGYMICFLAIKRMTKQKKEPKLEILCGVLIVSCMMLAFMRFYVSNDVLVWGVLILIMMLDLVLFYDIGVWVYEKTAEPYLPTKIKNLVLIGTVATLSRCLVLNIPILHWAMVLFLFLYRVYFIYGICCFLKDDI